MIKTISTIKRIFDEFEKNKIDCCIIRNYKFLLENKIYEGKDIDILILGRDKRKIGRILKKHGFGRVMINPFSMHRGYAKYIKEDKKLLQLHFHINGITGRHVKYLSAGDILKRKIKKDFFNAVSDEDEFLIILLHSILDAVKFESKYKEELRELLSKDLEKGYIEEKLSKLFGKKNSTKILNTLFKNDFNSIEKLMPELKKYFESRRRTGISWVYSAGSVWKLFHMAPLISIIGMDGAGKSTAIKNLAEIFKSSGIKYSMIYTGRGRDNILPIQFFGKPYKKAEKKIEEKNRKEKKLNKSSLAKKIIYTLAAPVFALDLFIRYFIRIFPERYKKQVVVTDRYSTDILLMANVPMPVKKFLYFFLPKPTFSIYLWNKPLILIKRKPDHTIEDLERQEKLFGIINKKIKPIRIKSESIEQTKEDVADAIFKMVLK